MNLSKLEKELINIHAPKDMYSLKGGLPNEAYTINNTGDTWEVYYSERGSKTNLKVFDSEGEACRYFLEMIKEII